MHWSRLRLFLCQSLLAACCVPASGPGSGGAERKGTKLSRRNSVRWRKAEKQRGDFPTQAVCAVELGLGTRALWAAPRQGFGPRPFDPGPSS